MDADVDFMAAESWVPAMDERLRWLRNNAPVFWSEKTGTWILSKFEHVSYVSKNHKIFCSGQGVRPGNPVKLALIDEDEPRHTSLRSLINRGFTPRMVRKLEEAFVEITTETLDAIVDRDHCDFVDDFAVPLPLLLIAEMIGIRREDRGRFHQWSDAMIAGDGNFQNPEIMAAAGQAFAEYNAYLVDIFADRRENPRDDLTSILVGAAQEGKLDEYERHTITRPIIDVPTPDNELISFMVLLLVAGNETTRNGISGGMQCLIENPEARQRLIAEPDLIPQAVEEMLRWVTPIRSFGRTATQEAELGGHKIKAGDTVLMIYNSANRDEDAYENPDTFDIDRNPQHLSFGIGNHFCLGANLARMEMRVAFREMLRRLPDMEYSAGGPEIVPSSLVRTIRHMHVKYTPERR